MLVGDGARDAEVGDDRLPVAQQNVLGLDVAVDDAVAVRVVERQRCLARDAHRLANRQLSLARHPVAERLALHERHRVPELTARVARVVDGQDVRMLKLGSEFDLALESLGTERRGEIGEQDLEGDRPVALFVDGEIHCRHAAATELSIDAVPSGEALAKAFDGIGHSAKLGVARPDSRSRPP